MSTLTYIVVESKLGPIGLIESADGLVATFVGYSSSKSLEKKVQERFPDAKKKESSENATLICRYAQGEDVSMTKIKLDDRNLTPFRRQVTKACRQISFGETVTYSQLAKKAGNPKAVRAAGNVMANNPWPIVVPCHRVLRSDGSLGGYSAPEGVGYKQSLLKHEMGLANDR